MPFKQFLSIVLPVYNESGNIHQQIEELKKKLKYDHEILVVYDFDEDTTVPVVKKLQKKLKTLRLIKNIFGRGVINAVKTGFKESKGDVIVVMPADLADNPDTINKMYEKISQGYDIVGSTRFSKGGKKIGGEFIKTNLSRIAGKLTPLLLGIPITDISNGFKMYRKKVINEIQITSDGGWEFTLELVIKARLMGFKIGEVASVWRNRNSGKSKFKLLRWLPKYIRWYSWGILKRIII